MRPVFYLYFSIEDRLSLCPKHQGKLLIFKPSGKGHLPDRLMDSVLFCPDVDALSSVDGEIYSSVVLVSVPTIDLFYDGCDSI